MKLNKDRVGWQKKYYICNHIKDQKIQPNCDVNFSVIYVRLLNITYISLSLLHTMFFEWPDKREIVKNLKSL